jgi:putative membrane-bound dehydrogenase-like protein
MRFVLRLAGCAALLVCALGLTAEPPPRTGPETEKRFPPLRVPPGFKATLFACDPLIEYPSVIALGPRPGSLFVAVDYMTGLGTEIVRRDEIRLIEDTDGDGYADKATVYASGFNSIQGLTYYNGTVYAMHAPLLTALRDTVGDGKADERRDLLTGLGLPPEQNPPRLHCANGVAVGHDGWLYLALGDHGCDVPRPEGDRLVLIGGGVLRCRPDGRDLHVFATGLRNIYDVALDDELNVFLRDNENDGGDYKIRVCHSFFGADHGYPYLYYERPDEALPPLADLGLGSSAGGLCYRERQFPAAYRGNLFFCEWGRSVVRYVPERAGSGFAPVKEHVFAAGAENDPYGFKPTSLVVERDGSLIVADWADGQRPKRGRGRIYRIRYVGETDGASRPAAGDAVARLDAESYGERVQAQEAITDRGQEGIKALLEALGNGKLGIRGRLHAVWVLARAGGPAVRDRLFNLADHDPDPRVQAQAVRALADLTDPVLTRHRLDAGPGDSETAARLAALGRGKEARIVLEVVVALGRLHWTGAPDWLRQTVTKPDAALAHAAMQTLRRSGNWPAVLKLLDLPAAEPPRAVALRAIADQAVPEVVDGLIDRLRTEPDPARRREYADTLTRVHQKRGQRAYWGYRPPPRPPNEVAWERTEAIEQALDRTLADPDRAVRLAILQRMQREKVPTGLDTLRRWLDEEKDAGRIDAILGSLREHPAGATRAVLEAVAAAKDIPPASRLAALALFAAGLDEASRDRLLALAGALEDGPVLAAAIHELGKRPKLPSAALLRVKLGSTEPAVRAAAVEALADVGTASDLPEDVLRKLLADADAGVRRAAAAAAGKLRLRTACPALLTLARDPDPAVRRASLESLRLLQDSRAVPLAVAALADSDTQAAALRCLADLGGPEQAHVVTDLARHNPSAEVLPPVLRMLTRWSQQPGAKRPEWERLAAELQGVSGSLVRWQVAGPLPAVDAPRVVDRLLSAPGDPVIEQTAFGAGTEFRVSLGPARGVESGAVWLAHTDLQTTEQTPVQFLAGSNGALRVWLNGRLLNQRGQARSFQPDADRFEAVLQRGSNRVLVEVSGAKGAAEFHVRFRQKSSTAEHEQLIQAALTRPGNAERGRKVFFDAGKSQCVRCHRLGDQGEGIGPELTGLGDRFSRVYIIESILEPSRTIAPNYQTVVVALKDGRVLTGVKVAEADGTLTLGDGQGNKHQVAKSDIEDQRPSPVSTMPDGLAKQLTTDEFVDLIAFLASQKRHRGP